MARTNSTPLDAAVRLTDDVADMAAYLRTEEGRAAIRRGETDIEEGRVLVGEGSLEAELVRRASARRQSASGVLCAASSMRQIDGSVLTC